MSTREGLSQFSLSWWLCAHSKLGRTKSARKLPKQKHSPPFCFPFLPLDVTGKTQKFQDKFESDLFGRFWGHMYTHDIRTIWKLIVINVPIVISWTFLVTPHSFRVLITIEQGIAVATYQNFLFMQKRADRCSLLSLKSNPIHVVPLHIFMARA